MGRNPVARAGAGQRWHNRNLTHPRRVANRVRQRVSAMRTRYRDDDPVAGVAGKPVAQAPPNAVTGMMKW
jgi:hypothetical protein